MTNGKNELEILAKNFTKAEISDISFRLFGEGGHDSNLIHRPFEGHVKVDCEEGNYGIELFLRNKKEKDLLPLYVLSPNKLKVVDSKMQIYGELSIYAESNTNVGCNEDSLSIHLKPFWFCLKLIILFPDINYLGSIRNNLIPVLQMRSTNALIPSLN